MNSNGRKKRDSSFDGEVCASSMRGNRKAEKKSQTTLATADVVRDTPLIEKRGVDFLRVCQA